MDSGAPNSEELASLIAVFDASNIHQGDFIQVFAPVVHSFNVELALTLSDPAAADAAEAAVEAVLDSWKKQLGGYIAPSQLIQAARGVAGVIEADVVNLALAAVGDNAWRNCTGLLVTVEVL